jgi:hypothetical protein
MVSAPKIISAIAERFDVSQGEARELVWSALSERQRLMASERRGCAG